MELLERGQFLGALGDCPPGRVVLVSGEAGIGKTSLVKPGVRPPACQALRYAAVLPAPSRGELLEAHSEVCADIRDPSALTASEQALDCWREAGDVARQAALMARRAHLQWNSGDNATAHQTAREAVALAERLPPGPRSLPHTPGRRT
jgi:hypothetical protein